MNYWWVNHKQTFDAEINGGYIWSPKTNRDLSRNQTYINLTKTNPGDIIFSYASGKIKEVGTVISRYQDQPRPKEFGKAGDWSDDGWAVSIEWQELDTPIIPREHIGSIAPLLPDVNSPIRYNGKGNQHCYLAEISSELGKLLLSIIRSSNPVVLALLNENANNITDDGIEANLSRELLGPTMIEQLGKARRGQGVFRYNVEQIEKQCRVTRVRRKDLLIASHIKPWRISSNEERLDGHNGLLLSPHIDKLFDLGYISFFDNGEMIVSSREIEEILLGWGIEPILNVGGFSIRQCFYLNYHRKNVFTGKLG